MTTHETRILAFILGMLLLGALVKYWRQNELPSALPAQGADFQLNDADSPPEPISTP